MKKLVEIADKDTVTKEYMQNKEENVDMCKAIEDMKKDARDEGIEKGMLKTLIGLVKDGILTLADAAKRANMTVTEFEQKTGFRES